MQGSLDSSSGLLDAAPFVGQTFLTNRALGQDPKNTGKCQLESASMTRLWEAAQTSLTQMTLCTIQPDPQRGTKGVAGFGCPATKACFADQFDALTADD